MSISFPGFSFGVVNFLSRPSAKDATTAPAFINVCIFRSKFMPSFAACFAGVFGRWAIASKVVFLMSTYSQVLWIKTKTIITKMVNGHSFGNISHQNRPCNTMNMLNWFSEPLNSHKAISSFFVPPTSPIPTATDRTQTMIKKAAYNLGFSFAKTLPFKTHWVSWLNFVTNWTFHNNQTLAQ